LVPFLNLLLLREDVRTPKKLMLEENQFASQYKAWSKFDKINSAVRLLQVSCRTVFAATTCPLQLYAYPVNGKAELIVCRLAKIVKVQSYIVH